MPEKEFQLYLSLLSRLLRLSPEQTAAISDELRDHLEERFAENLSRGLSREEAIQAALDELGDASGLAREFTVLSRQRYRRWVMRGSVTAAAVALAVWAFMSNAPVQPGGGAGQPVVAQDAAPSDPAALPAVEVVVDEAHSPLTPVYISAGSEIPEELRRSFDEELLVPLSDLVFALRQQTGANWLFQWNELEDEGISPDQEVRLLGGIPIYQELNRICEVDLAQATTWFVRDEVYVLTTKASAESELTTIAYDVGDLLEGGLSARDLREILFLGTNEPWEDSDGYGGVLETLGNVLMVRQTPRGLSEIETVLSGLRSEATVTYVGVPARSAKLEEALNQTVAIEFDDVPLSDAVMWLSEQAGVQFVVDELALAEFGLETDVPFNVVLNDISLRSALRILLDGVSGGDLVVVPRHGVFLITTKERAEELSEIVILRLGSFMSREQRFAFVDFLMRGTSGPWHTIDGIGGELYVTVDGTLVIRQTLPVISEVIRLVERHHQLASHVEPEQIDPEKVEVRMYRLPLEVAQSLADAIPLNIAPETWMASGHPDAIGHLNVVALGQVNEDSPKNYSGEGGGFFQIAMGSGGMDGGFGGTPGGKGLAATEKLGILIVRQKVRVHEQIDRFIHEVLYGRYGAEGAGLGFQFLGGMRSEALTP